nr:protein lutein deficient 5, chloroplastic [Tanacetum cinerariifolium]
MATNLPTLQFPSSYLQTHNKFNLKSPSFHKFNGVSRSCGIKCSSSNGRKPNSSEEKSGKSLEMSQEEKKRAELSARIASGAFTVEKPRLTFGPKSFLIVSDPNIAKRILKDNAKAY